MIDNEKKGSFIEISIYSNSRQAAFHRDCDKMVISFRSFAGMSQFKVDVPFEIGRASE